MLPRLSVHWSCHEMPGKTDGHNRKIPLKMPSGTRKRGILRALERNGTFGRGKWLKSTKPVFSKIPKMRSALKWILQGGRAFSCLTDYENIRHDYPVRPRSAVSARIGAIKRSRRRSRRHFFRYRLRAKDYQADGQSEGLRMGVC